MMQKHTKRWFILSLVLLFTLSAMGSLPAGAAQNGPPDIVILYTSDGRGNIKCEG